MALAYAYIALYFVVAQETIEGLIKYIKCDVTEKEKRPQRFQDENISDFTRTSAFRNTANNKAERKVKTVPKKTNHQRTDT